MSPLLLYDTYSEVLLSSEARIITFVNKQGFRTEHSLDDVLHSGKSCESTIIYTYMIIYHIYTDPCPFGTALFYHSGRLDIAKRLKYTKDIMYRLINTQSKV